jgi:hypothetical protein
MAFHFVRRPFHKSWSVRFLSLAPPGWICPLMAEGGFEGSSHSDVLNACGMTPENGIAVLISGRHDRRTDLVARSEKEPRCRQPPSRPRGIELIGHGKRR